MYVQSVVPHSGNKFPSFVTPSCMGETPDPLVSKLTLLPASWEVSPSRAGRGEVSPRPPLYGSKLPRVRSTSSLGTDFWRNLLFFSLRSVTCLLLCTICPSSSLILRLSDVHMVPNSRHAMRRGDFQGDFTFKWLETSQLLKMHHQLYKWSFKFIFTLFHLVWKISLKRWWIINKSLKKWDSCKNQWFTHVWK